MKTITYFYQGQIERGTGRGYAWFDGFSENTKNGAATFPWMTRAECRDNARQRGARALFANEQMAGLGAPQGDPQPEYTADE